MGGYNSVLQAGDTKDGLKFNMSNKMDIPKKWIWTAKLNEAIQNNNNNN